MPIGFLDASPSNQRERRANGELFARLLYAPAEGNALFHPRKVGSVLDCGYIETGSFTKLFNASDPPAGIDRFSLSLDLDTDLRDNSEHVLKSSATRSIKFKFSVTDALPMPDTVLPAAKHPLEITPEITRSSDDFAFLAFAGSQREVQTVKMPDRIRLEAWFVHNSAQILDAHHMPAMQVIFQTVKSAGWVGGVAHRQRNTTAGSITGHVSHFLRANVALENASDVDTGLIDTRGPPGRTPWSADAPRDYTIVVEYIQITKRTKWRNSLRLFLARAQRAMSKGKTAQFQKQEGGMANPPEVSNAGEQLPRSNEPDVGAAAGDDMGPDRTVLTVIMERAGHGAQDDEIIVVASSQIIQEYLKTYDVEPDAESVRYDVERVAISNGMFALRVVRLHGPENVEDISQRHASPLSQGRTLPVLSAATFDGVAFQIALSSNTAFGVSGSAKVYKGDVFSPHFSKGSNPIVVAVKVFDGLGHVEKQILHKELQAACIVSLRHPLILACLGTAYEQSAFVSLYMRNGNLLDYLKAHHDCDKKRLILQVAQAVDYLHTVEGLVHGGLKCANVLVSDYEEAVLADFGLSSFTTNSASIYQLNRIRFAAPELLIDEDKTFANSQAKTRESDVYAFGMLVLEALTENSPWAGVNDMGVVLHVCNGKQPSRPSSGTFVTASHAWWETCSSCWSYAPQDRPSMPSILRTLEDCDLYPYRQLVGHTSGVPSVAYFPDGGRFVSCDSYGSIRIWDAVTARMLVDTFYGHDGLVHSVAVSPNGLQICSGGRDHTIRRWDAGSGTSIGQPMTGHADEVNCVACSPDGTRIVSCSADKTVRVWDATTGAELVQIGHIDVARSVAFSPTGACIASGSSDGTIRLWDSATGAGLGDLHQPGSATYSVCFTPDGMHLVSSFADGAVRVWDITTGQLEREIRAHTAVATSVSISPSGRYIASGSHDMTVRIWDAQTGDAVGRPLTQQTAGILSVAFSPDGRSLVAGSEDGTVGIWDLFE